MQILLEERQSGSVERSLVELQHGHGDPKESSVDERVLSEEWLQPGEAHDERLQQHHVVEALERLHQDAQQLLDVVVRGGFADAAEDDEGARLQRRIVAEGEVPGQQRPRLQPVAVGDVAHARLHYLEQRVHDHLQRGQRQTLSVRFVARKTALAAKSRHCELKFSVLFLEWTKNIKVWY